MGSVIDIPIIFGLYSAMTDGVGRALASKLINHEVLASGQGFLAAAIGVSSLLAGLIGGTIWTFWGSSLDKSSKIYLLKLILQQVIYLV